MTNIEYLRYELYKAIEKSNKFEDMIVDKLEKGESAQDLRYRLDLVRKRIFIYQTILKSFDKDEQ